MINAQNGRISIKTIILISLAVIVVSVGIIMWTSRQDSEVPTGATTAGSEFTNALVNHDATNTYAMLTEDFGASLSEESWQQWVSINFVRQQAQSVKLLSSMHIENLGNVYAPDEQPVRLIYEFDFESDTYSLPIVLVMENEEWKINELGAFE